MKFLVSILLIVLGANVSAQTLSHDKITYQYVPPSHVETLAENLDSVYGRYGITLPALDKEHGWLQIRMLTIENDIIYGLYEKLPEDFGVADEKSEGNYMWKSVKIPNIMFPVDLRFKFYGVSSYTSRRGSPLLTQLVWLSISAPNGGDMIPTSNDNYLSLVRYIKSKIESIEPVTFDFIEK